MSVTVIYLLSTFIPPGGKASVSDSSRRELSVAGLRSTGDLLVATQPLGKVLLSFRAIARQGG